MQEVKTKGIEDKVLRSYSTATLQKLQKGVRPSTAARIESILSERGQQVKQLPPFQDCTLSDLMRAVSELTLAGNEPALKLIHHELNRRLNQAA